jgi:glycosyltransferase involved in cell wall biosynthesis
MRVLLDARTWHGSYQTGVERYVALLVEALSITRSVELHVVIQARQMAAFRQHVHCDRNLCEHAVQTRHSWELQRVIDYTKPDLLHAPFELPTGLRSCPIIYTLHDAGRYIYPELMVARVRDHQNPLLLRALKEQYIRSIITVSNASKDDIMRILPLRDTECHVVTNFVGREYREAAAFPSTLIEVRDKYGIEGDFLIAVGVFSPTKNTRLLCDAFELARRRYPSVVPDKLLLVGRRGWDRSVRDRIRTGIICTGHVPEQDLAALYRHAEALVFPSIYEGFGIPILEALLVGCRVLCSDLPVFREVGGDAIFPVQCTTPSDLAEALPVFLQDFYPSSLCVSDTLSRYSATCCATQLISAYEQSLQ